MHLVGKKLSELAIAESDSTASDLYGRSAFNRYYYGAYLITRSMLAIFDKKWVSQTHKSIPDLLRGGVCVQAKREIKRQVDGDLIEFCEGERMKAAFINAASELANLLTIAYDSRVIADYEPNQLLKKVNGVLVLADRKITIAETWSDGANRLTKVMIRIWVGLGLA